MEFPSSRSLAERIGRRVARTYRTGIGRIGPLRPLAYENETLESVLATRDVLERILTDNILPYWDTRVVDETGGYYLAHDAEGNVAPTETKHVIGQARTLWFYSRLAASPRGSRRHFEIARHGFEGLRDEFWDHEHGGFFVHSPREAPVAGKHALAQCFGLFALSQYAMTSGDESAAALAGSLFDTFDAVAYDEQHGSYREVFASNWSPAAAPLAGLPGHPGHRTINFHLHMLEALMAYHQLTGQSRAAERLQTLITVLTVTTLDEQVGAGVDAFWPDWSVVDEKWNRVVSYGHELERLWMVLDATSCLGLSPGPLIPLMRRIFTDTLRYGYDRARGGFYLFGRLRGAAAAREKTWWVQAEALQSALKLWRVDRSTETAATYLRTLDWVTDYQADWRIGEWHHTIDERGAPTGPKALPAWKTPYHTGRAMLECLDLLEVASQSPEVAR